MAKVTGTRNRLSLTLVVRLIIVSILLFATYLSASNALVAINTIDTDATIRQIQSKTSLDTIIWEDEKLILTNAIERQPRNPDFHLKLGQLHEYRRLVDDRSLEQYAQDLRLSAKSYQAATELRPTWPYAWAHLANAKSLLGEVDESFIEAVSRSVVLGPWEPPVQRLVSASGFRRWTLLDDNTQNMVLENSIRGLRSPSSRQSKDMTLIISNYQMVSQVCDSLNESDEQITLCK